MPRPSRPTFQKRLKEKARMEKARDKMQRRAEIKERKAAEGPRSLPGEDPDIAGIRPGPQAVPEEWAPFIADEEADHFSLCVTPQHFAGQMEILSELTTILSMEMLSERLAARDIPRGSIAISFDDGYADNLHAAQPVLTRLGVPATVFVATSFVGTTFWWDTAANMVESIPDSCQLRLRVGDSCFSWPVAPGASSADDSLLKGVYEFLLPLSEAERATCMEQLRGYCSGEKQAVNDARALSKRELIDLASDPLVSIGAHSVTHPLLAHLSPKDQHREVLQSKQVLEAMVGQEIAGFSYPNGSKSKDTIRVVRECGFQYACASYSDVVWRGSNPFCLPRLWVPNYPKDKFLAWLNQWL